MKDCLDCKGKDKEISILKGTIEFHKGEERYWRKAFNEQRGGEVFNQLQKDYAEAVVENIRLNNELMSP